MLNTWKITNKIDGSYTYLLSMAIYSLTKERFEELLKQKTEKESEVEAIKKTDPKDMYITDLEQLKKSLG